MCNTSIWKRQGKKIPKVKTGYFLEKDKNNKCSGLNIQTTTLTWYPVTKENSKIPKKNQRYHTYMIN